MIAKRYSIRCQLHVIANHEGGNVELLVLILRAVERFEGKHASKILLDSKIITIPTLQILESVLN